MIPQPLNNLIQSIPEKRSYVTQTKQETSRKLQDKILIRHQSSRLRNQPRKDYKIFIPQNKMFKN